MALYSSKYNENLAREFYANISEGVDISTNPAFEVVYVRGTPIALTPSNISFFMSCPHYEDLEGTSLEGDIEWNTIAHVLTGDKKATWPANNTLAVSQLLPVCNTLFRLNCGIWMPTTNVAMC